MWQAGHDQSSFLQFPPGFHCYATTQTWAARYITWLPMRLTPKGFVFFFGLHRVLQEQQCDAECTCASGEALRLPAIPATAVATSGDCLASPSAFLFLLLSACMVSLASTSCL